MVDHFDSSRSDRIDHQPVRPGFGCPGQQAAEATLAASNALADTIAACATPPGQSGVALVRLSGPASVMVAGQIFRPLSPRFPAVAAMPGYTCVPGYIIDPALASAGAAAAIASDRTTGTAELDSAAWIDQVVLTRFSAPHSYTGEDVIEITCHGGTAVKQAILDLLYRLGVQPAGPGEFTRRAFLNGKMDLSQAEAVMDLIAAQAGRRSQVAVRQLHGQLSARILQVRQSLYDLLAQIELILEYPEYDDEQDQEAGLADALAGAGHQIAALTDSFRQGRMLSEGLTVVIAGRPNAGKSSLLNALAGCDRSIVTALPGTTRDTVEQLVDIDGLPVRLIDTAGLHPTVDIVERLGVERARTALLEADLVIWIASPPLDQAANELDEIRDWSEQVHAMLLVAGKDDLTDSTALRSWLQQELPDLPQVSFSAVTLEGLADIRRAISERYTLAGSPACEDLVITNVRHKTCLDQSLARLQRAREALGSGLPLDLVASLVRNALEILAEITGDSVSDELVATIFSRFCIGK